MTTIALVIHRAHSDEERETTWDKLEAALRGETDPATIFATLAAEEREQGGEASVLMDCGTGDALRAAVRGDDVRFHWGHCATPDGPCDCGGFEG